MTADEILAQFMPLCNERIKKMWLTHGALEPCLGVKVEDMKIVQKQIKKNYQLALDLFDTGISDMMYFAGLIADDDKMTQADLQKWVEAAHSTWIFEYTVPWVASSSSHGRVMALKWMESEDEKIAACGWHTYGSLVAIMQDELLNMDEISTLLLQVENTLHQQADQVKLAMNSFVIAVACYVQPLHEQAQATADSLGKIEVDVVGSCKIAYAPDQINKFMARSPIGKKRKSPKC
jgi:3-methyladenine DNA glycosylase AlkD